MPDSPTLTKPAPTREERRARREARRAKQRIENVGRAASMHTARTQWQGTQIAEHGFALPRINIGCSGWFYWHWRGDFYPQAMPTAKWFGHYAAHFKTVELNAPFYSWPTPATVQNWMQQVGRRKFVYTVKVSELITHVKRFTRTRNLIRDFGHIADLLGPHMGCFLFQLPPSFHYTGARLQRVVSQLDSSRRNVVEFRHSSWWNERVFAAFRERGIIFCSSSGPHLPDELIKTADEIYVRFHGIKQWYRHDYSREELVLWAERIKTSRAARVWVYFNNDRNGFAIRNARQLTWLLRTQNRTRALGN